MPVTSLLPRPHTLPQPRSVPGEIGASGAPLLAQIQAVTVDGGDPSLAADLITALRERGVVHPGHRGLVEMADGEDQPTTHASLWHSVADLRAYVHAAHADIVDWQRRTGLHLTTERALWWVNPHERVTAARARERMEHLRRLGPTRHAFTLRGPVPPPAR